MHPIFRPRFARLGLAAVMFSLTPTVRADLDFTVDGRPYRLVTTPATWDAAEAAAVTLGGQLVHIDSEAENAAILAAIRTAVPPASTAASGGGSVYVWIGGKEAEEGRYEWSDSLGTPFWSGGTAGAAAVGSYQNWGRSASPLGGPEPDNFGGTQNRMAMAITAWPTSAPVGSQIGQAGQWNDLASSNPLAYVVEMSGIYASFRMTHGGVQKGTFSAKLFYGKAPLAVANFVSLAEGSRAFIDFRSGNVAKRPFFDGLTWHRIIPGFMCQGGDPAGNGSGGPGYSFPDQFDATLRHDKVGLLSLANSGPHTNGSQFFVTVATTAWLDDKHTVFGEVVNGYAEVVQPLSLVPANGSVPLAPVIMESVLIHRAGTAARAFNTGIQALPKLNAVQAQVSINPANVRALNWPRTPNSAYSLLHTSNLHTWVAREEFVQASTIGTESVNIATLFPAAALPPKQFFRVADAKYPNTFFSPTTLQGQKVTSTSDIQMIFSLSTANTGTWSIVSPVLTGPINDYLYEQTPHGGRLRCAIGGLSVGGSAVTLVDLGMLYQTANSGGGNLYLNGGNGSTLLLRVNGTFATAPLP